MRTPSQIRRSSLHLRQKINKSHTDLFAGCGKPSRNTLEWFRRTGCLPLLRSGDKSFAGMAGAEVPGPLDQNPAFLPRSCNIRANRAATTRISTRQPPAAPTLVSPQRPQRRPAPAPTARTTRTTPARSPGLHRPQRKDRSTAPLPPCRWKKPAPNGLHRSPGSQK